MSITACADLPATTSEAAEEGTLAHEVAEIVAGSEDRITLESPEWQRVTRDPRWSPEMLDYALDYRDFIRAHSTAATITALEQKVDLSDWLPGGYGFADCLLIDDDILTVIDYKYGKGVKVECERNGQIMIYARGALKWCEDLGPDIESVHLYIFQPRINNISGWTISAADLRQWAEETLKPAADLAYSGKGYFHPGESQCRFCRYAGMCKALQCEAFDLYSHYTDLSPADYAEALAKIPLIKIWLDRVEGKATDMLMHGEEIPGYKLVAGRMGARKWTDSGKVLSRLFASDIGEEEYMTAPELMSPSALEKSIGKKRFAELVADLTAQAPGKPTVVPASDKRPAYHPEDDFERLEN